MQKLFYLFYFLCSTFCAFSQDEIEYAPKEIQRRRISKILIWEQQATWDKNKSLTNNNVSDSCVYIEKEYDTKGRLIAMTENYCPEKMHHRGDYYTYDNLGRVAAHSRSEYGIGEVEFRGVRYEDLIEYDSMLYDQGLKQTRVIEYDEHKKMLNKKTFQDDSLQESREYIYNTKGLLISESGMHRKIEFQKTYKYNLIDSISEEKIYQGDDLIQKELFEYNSDKKRKSYIHIAYQDTDSIVHLTQYEYYGNHHIRKISISENDEKGVLQVIQLTEYDKAGNITKEESHIDINNPTSEEFTYTNKNQVKSIHWKQSEKLVAEATYHYNNHELLTNYEYKENGQKRHIHYIYDKNDLLIEKIFKTDDQFNKKYNYTYQYYD